MSNIRILTKNNIRIYISDLTEIANTAITKNKTSPLGSIVLGTSIAVFGPLATIKRVDKISAVVNGKGACGTIIVDSTSKGDVRGMISIPNVATDVDKTNPNLIPITVGVGVNGTLKILQINQGQSFGGEVKLAKGNIVTDMAYYFDKSDQTKTAVISSILLSDDLKIKRAYSILFQMLPSYTEEDIKWVEQFVKVNKIDKLSLKDYEKKVNGIFLEERYVQWSCSCEKNDYSEILGTLTPSDKEELIKKHGAIIITCNFCKNIKKFKE